jgi:very-short-patch-repair endonuclease
MFANATHENLILELDGKMHDFAADPGWQALAPMP